MVSTCRGAFTFSQVKPYISPRRNPQFRAKFIRAVLPAACLDCHTQADFFLASEPARTSLVDLSVFYYSSGIFLELPIFNSESKDERD
jgi:hypothetical protein